MRINGIRTSETKPTFNGTYYQYKRQNAQAMEPALGHRHDVGSESKHGIEKNVSKQFNNNV